MGNTQELSRPDNASIESLLKAQAYGLGFDLVGITQLGTSETAKKFESWLDHGYAGTMDYMERGREKRRDTRLPFAGARTAIVVAMNYGGTQRSGPIARYARGRDYHKVMTKKLRALHHWLDETTGHHVAGKAYVDTGPILERELARNAGLGWFGKNTNLINPRLGSFFFIGALLLDFDLESDAAFASEHCGTCTRCIDACPTHAILDAGVLDATRCISYQTIENRGPIPDELRPLIGELIYGCDICQDVCPWNEKFSSAATEPELAPRTDLESPDYSQLLQMTDAEYSVFFSGSPIKRAKRAGLARNVAIAMGNREVPDDRAALEATRRADNDPTLVEACNWALDRIAKNHV